MKFSEYTYVRVDVEKVRADYAALTERVQNACTAEDVFACVEEHEKIAKHVGTMLTIANIRNTIDTRDPFYEAEKAFIDENGPLLDEASQRFMRALCESSFRPALEGKYGRLLFLNIELELKTFKPEIIELLQEENALTTAYTKLIAGARIPFDGKELTIAQLGPYKIDPDRATRRAAYCAEGAFIRANGDELDEIFDKLVSVRTKIAEALGEKSFVEVAYNRNLRNCYAKKDVEAFRAQVVRDIVPIVETLKKRQSDKIGVPDMKLYDQNFFDKDGNAKPEGASEEILAAGRAILEKVGCPHLLTTLGSDGMALFSGPSEVWHVPTMAQDVFDVTGAGDTVIATLGLGLAAGLPLLASCVLANYAAGLVVAQVGAAVASPDALREAIRELPVTITKW